MIGVRSGVAADLALGDGEGTAGVCIEIIRKVASAPVIGMVLSTGRQDGEEVSTVCPHPAGHRSAVQPDILLSIIDITVDSWIAVPAVPGAVYGCIDGCEDRSGCGRHGGGERRERSQCRPYQHWQQD